MSRTDHRLDIQGLRAVAVSLVVVFHLWPAAVPGGYVGVDVFFVISGFLITSHLVRKAPEGRAGLVDFWTRRVRRLLPASLLVLAVTIVATRLFATADRWHDTAVETIAAALYVENWQLSRQAVDYLATDAGHSAVQHFWSLSVEEQFYAGWPVLVLLCGWIARRNGRRLQVTGLAIGLVTAASFAWSLYYTAQNPAAAYFVTLTRVWELGVGALLAVWVVSRGSVDDGRTDTFALPGPVRSALAWAGLAMISAAAFLYSSTTAFPGHAAALPVLGTALVIAVHAGDRWSPLVALGTRPAQFLGDVSYSLYLWHWPVLVLLPDVLGRPLGDLDRVGALVLAVVLAQLTKVYVEDRFRRPGPRSTAPRTLVAVLAGMSLVVAAAAVPILEVRHRADAEKDDLAAALSDPCFGAGALDPASGCPPQGRDGVLPSPETTKDDLANVYARGCILNRPFASLRTCTYGDADSDVRVAVIGNSHAAQWMPALSRVARQQHWRLDTYLITECFPTDVALDFAEAGLSENCRAWQADVTAAITGGGYDVAIGAAFTGLRPVGLDAGPEADAQLRAGYQRFLGGLQDSGVTTIALRDTPFPKNTLGDAPASCVAAHLDDLDACSATREEWTLQDRFSDAARSIGVPVVDLTDRFCTDRCGAVVGGAMVYRDGGHMTATYARTLTPYLYAALRPHLPELARSAKRSTDN